MGIDAQRAKVYEAAKATWGQEVADAVMEVLPPWDHAEVVRKVDLENATVALQSQIEGLRVELRGEMSELRGEVRGEIGELRGRIDAQFGRMITVNAAMLFGFAGVAFAAAKLI